MPREERPLGSEDTPLQRFAGDLRRLRRDAGSPSYRELGRRASYSAAALSEAVSGRRLPSLSVTTALVRACEGDVATWTARWRTLAASAPVPGGGEPSPYVGLAAYQVEDAERFFGREQVTADLLRLIGDRPFVGVFGSSGAGKSSLLRAGLAARSERPTIVLTPGSDPISELAVRLAAAAGEPAADARADLAADPAGLRRRLLRVADDVLLVVDQFEEVFSLCAEPDRVWLIRALTSAAGPGTRVVVGVRADFYGHCGQYPELTAALHRAQLLLGPMTADELRRAITEPAARAGASLETALVARLISDVAGQPAALPLVSHVLAETWARRRGVVLSLAGYLDAGGVEHALARSAERTYAALSPDEQAAARLLFLRLVAPGDGTADTRRRVGRGEVEASAGLLDRLAAARLVSLDHDTVELTHEALLRAWPRLAAWIAENREALREHRRLAEAAQLWQAADRDPDTLYRGARLEAARLLQERLNPLEDAFLRAGDELARDQAAGRRQQVRRLRWLAGGLALLTVLLAGSTVVAVGAQRAAARERNQALSLRAAEAAGRRLPDRPRDAAALALAAYRVSPTAESRAALTLADAAAGAARLGAGFVRPPGRIAITTETGPTGTPAGHRLWRPEGAGWRKAGLLPGDGFFYLITPDEGTVLVFDEQEHTQLWDVTDADRPRRIPVPSGPPLPPVSGTDRTGRLLTAVDEQGHAVLWRVGDGPVRRLSRDGVETAAVLADGTGLLLGIRHGDRRAVELTRLDGSTVATVLRPTTRMDLFAGPGHLLLALDPVSGRAVLLDIGDPRSPRTVFTVSGIGDAALAAFDAAGRQLAIVDRDTVTVWDTASGAVRLSLKTYGIGLHAPGFGPGDGRLSVVAGDGRLWRLDSRIDDVLRRTCAAPPAIDWDQYFPGVSRPALCP